VELLANEQVVGLDHGIGRRDRVRVPVLEAGEDLLQQGDQERPPSADQDALRHVAHASRYTSTSTDLPLTRTAGSCSRSNRPSSSRRVSPLTRMSEPNSLLRL